MGGGGGGNYTCGIWSYACQVSLQLPCPSTESVSYLGFLTGPGLQLCLVGCIDAILRCFQAIAFHFMYCVPAAVYVVYY